MRRVRYYEFGGPTVLTVEEAPVPRPGPGQVQLETEVVGAGWVDTTLRAGTSPLGLPALPGSPHGDVVGRVREVGDGVDPALVGRRVVALVPADAYADVVLADARSLVEVPEGVGPGEASVLGSPAPVALLALRTGLVTSGETVLVHSAAGGIGQLAMQLARLEGASRVIATVGSRGKVAAAHRLGADAAVARADEDWAEQVRAVAPDGVDVLLDGIGGSVSATGPDLLAPFGRQVIYGAACGVLPEIPAAPLLGLRTVTGFAVMAYRAARPAAFGAAVADVVEHVAAGRLHVDVHATVPLEEAATAHQLLEDRDRVGRVLLVP